MIVEKNYIKAEDGKILHCTFDNKLYNEFWLGTVYYKNGIKLENPYTLTKSDFEELNIPNDTSEYIDNNWYDFKNKSYSEIKTFIIKLHYSNDDQIAIILNDDEDKMREMQEWREFASLTAKKYSN